MSGGPAVPETRFMEMRLAAGAACIAALLNWSLGGFAWLTAALALVLTTGGRRR